MSWVFKHSNVDESGERLVLLVLADHARGEDGSGAFPSVNTIASEARLSRRHVFRILAKLEEEGHIEREGHTSFGCTRWKVIMGDVNMTRVSPTTPAMSDTPPVSPTTPKPSSEPSVTSLISDDLDDIIEVLDEARRPKSPKVRREGVMKVVQEFPGVDHMKVAKAVRAKSYGEVVRNVPLTFHNWCAGEDRRGGAGMDIPGVRNLRPDKGAEKDARTRERLARAQRALAANRGEP